MFHNDQSAWQVPFGVAVLDHIDPSSLLTVSGTVLTALISGIVTWAIARAKTKTDAQSAITSGFQALMKELQTENVKLIDRLEKTNAKVDELTKVNAELETEVRSFRRHIDRLERAMTGAGLTIPPSENRQ